MAVKKGEQSMEKATQDNRLKAWPEDWPLYKQANFASFEDACDVLVGPCSCGAWHKEGEFEFKDGILFRYDKQVRSQKEINEGR